MSAKKIPVLSFFLIFALLLPGTAFAYLDPGTGSMIIQGILAAVAAVGVSVGIFWKKLKTLFGERKEEGEGQKKDDI